MRDQEPTDSSTNTDTGVWYEGGCHCGAVRFRVRLYNNRALACNCSICAKKGFINLIATEDDFDLLKGADVLSTYQFNTKVARHQFCSNCGVHTHTRPRSHPEGYDVNARCLDAGSDFLDITPFDGQNWESSVESIR